MRVEILIDHLVHDGHRIAQGAVLDLDDAAAAALIALGAARAEAPVEPTRKRGKQPD